MPTKKTTHMIVTLLTIIPLKYLMQNETSWHWQSCCWSKTSYSNSMPWHPKYLDQIWKTIWWLYWCPYTQESSHWPTLWFRTCTPQQISCLSVHQQSFKKELHHMVDIGILKEFGASVWTLLYFIIPNKDGSIRKSLT